MSAPHTSQIIWRSIAVRITFRTRHWNSEFDHIEIESEERSPLPLTRNGYRSHFLPHGIVGDHQCVENYVTEWLDHETLRPAVQTKCGE